MGLPSAWARSGALVIAGLCATCADQDVMAGAAETPDPAAATQSSQDAAPTSSTDEVAAPAVPAWPSQDAAPLLKALVAGSWSLLEGEDFADDKLDGEADVRVAYTRRRAGKSRRKWVGLRTEGDALGVGTYFDSQDPREGESFCYVYALVQRNIPDALLPETVIEPQRAVLHLRHRGRLRAWFDGELVLDEPAPPLGEARHVTAPVTMTDAFDVLLLKLGRGGELGETFDVEVRVATPEGEPVEHFQWNTMRPNHLPPDVAPEMLR